MEYKIIDERDHQRVIEHLRRTFFIDEPLNKAVELCPNGEGHEELENQCIMTMNDGLSLLAYEDGYVMGVALNGILKPGDSSHSLTKLKMCDDEKFAKIFSLLYGITENLDLFNKYDVSEIFECKIVSVDQRARGKGLAGELVKRSIEIARNEGYKIFKGDATGIFSQRICEKNGMETLAELYYKDYLDPETGFPVFDVPPPHKTLKIMTLCL